MKLFLEITTAGVKNDAIASYYNIINIKNHNNNNDNDSLLLNNEKENEKLKESENFIKSIETYMGGIIYFFLFNKFIRHNFPLIRGKVKSLLKNKD